MKIHTVNVNLFCCNLPIFSLNNFPTEICSCKHFDIVKLCDTATNINIIADLDTNIYLHNNIYQKLSYFLSADIWPISIIGAVMQAVIHPPPNKHLFFWYKRITSSLNFCLQVSAFRTYCLCINDHDN